MPKEDFVVIDHVELTLPARPDMLVLARMTVGAVAARADMAVDDIEDLRLAIDELCLSAVGDKRSGRLELRYDWGPAGMEVSCTFKATDIDHQPSSPDGFEEQSGDEPGTLPTELSERILDALVDEHGRDDVEGGQRAWFRKLHEKADD